MKKTILTLLATAVALATSGNAATILIDYNDGVAGGGHDAAVRNGGFESGTNAYSTGNSWVNGAGNPATSVYSTTSKTGSYSGIVSAASVPTNDTGYTIAAGDVITLTFWAKAVDATPRDIAWHLGDFSSPTFTDFAVGGTATVTATSTYQEFTGTKTVGAGDALIGQSLAVQFTRVADAGFPVIDNVFLSVVPEPSSALLGGLGLLALLRRRRA